MRKNRIRELFVFFLCVMTMVSSLSNVLVVKAEENTPTDPQKGNVVLTMEANGQTIDITESGSIHVDTNLLFPQDSSEDTVTVTISANNDAVSFTTDDSSVAINNNQITFVLDGNQLSKSFDIGVTSKTVVETTISSTISINGDTNLYDVNNAQPIQLSFVDSSVQPSNDPIQEEIPETSVSPIPSDTPIPSMVPTPSPSQQPSDTEQSDMSNGLTMDDEGSTEVSATNDSLQLVSTSPTMVKPSQFGVLNYNVTSDTYPDGGVFSIDLTVPSSVFDESITQDNFSWENNALIFDHNGQSVQLLAIPNIAFGDQTSIALKESVEQSTKTITISWEINQQFNINSPVTLNSGVMNLVDGNTVTLAMSVEFTGGTTLSSGQTTTFSNNGATSEVNPVYSIGSTTTENQIIYWVDNNINTRPSNDEVTMDLFYQIDGSNQWIKADQLLSNYPGLLNSNGSTYTLSNVNVNDGNTNDSQYEVSALNLPTTINIGTTMGIVDTVNLDWKLQEVAIAGYVIVNVNDENDHLYPSVGGTHGIYYIKTTNLDFHITLNLGNDNDAINAILNLLQNVKASDGGFSLSVEVTGGGTVSGPDGGTGRYDLSSFFDDPSSGNTITLDPNSTNNYTIHLPNTWQYNIDGRPINYSIYRTEQPLDRQDQLTNDTFEKIDVRPNLDDGDTIDLTYNNSGVTNFGSIDIGGYNDGRIIFTLRGTTGYTAYKQWQDQAQEAKRPDGYFELLRYRDGENYTTAAPIRDSEGNIVRINIETNPQLREQIISTDNSIPVKGGQTLSSITTSLPKYDPEGYLYVYVLKEYMDAPSGDEGRYEQIMGYYDDSTNTYIDTYPFDGQTRDEDNTYIYHGGTITNILEDAVVTPLTKTWHAASFQADMDDITIVFQLQRSSDGGTTWHDVSGQTTSMDGFTSESMSQSIDSYAFPRYLDGIEYTYRWKESQIIRDGSTPINVVYDTDGIGSFTLNHGDETITYRVDSEYGDPTSTVVNSHITNTPIGTLTYDFEKLWMANGAFYTPQDGRKAHFILYQIDASGKISALDDSTTLIFILDGAIDQPMEQPMTIGSSTYTIRLYEDSPWSYHIEGLPRFDQNGGEYSYLLIEVDASGSRLHPDMDIQRDENENYTGMVINSDGVMNHIDVQKRWTDDSDLIHRQPVVVNVYDGQTNAFINSATLDPSNGWMATIAIGEYDPSEVYILESSLGQHTVYLRNQGGATTDPVTDDPTNPINGSTSRVDRVTGDYHSYDVLYSKETLANAPLLVVTNRRLGNVDLTVHKTWADGNGTARNAINEMNEKLGIRAAVMLAFDPLYEYDPTMYFIDENGVRLAGESGQIVPILDKDGNQVSFVQDIPTDGVETTVYFHNLPKYDMNGSVAHYVVQEGWRVGYATDLMNTNEIVGYINGLTTLNQEDKDRYIDIIRQMSLSTETDYTVGEDNPDAVSNDTQEVYMTNRLSRTIDVIWYKQWLDAYVAENGDRPDIYLNIYRASEKYVEGGQTTEVVVERYQPNYQWEAPDNEGRSESWSVTLHDAPMYNEYGYPYTYYAVERSTVNTAQFDYAEVEYRYPSVDDPNTLIQVGSMYSGLVDGLDETYGDTVVEIDDPYEDHGDNTLYGLKQGGTFVNRLESYEQFDTIKLWSDLPEDFDRSDLPPVTFDVYQGYDSAFDPEHFDANETKVATVTVSGWNDVYTSTNDRYTFPIDYLGNYSIRFVENGYTITPEDTALTVDDLQRLPTYDANGDRYYYHLVETNIGEIATGYFTINNPLHVFSVENRFTSPTVDLTIRKIMHVAQTDIYPAVEFSILRSYTDAKGNQTEEVVFDTIVMSSDDLRSADRDNDEWIQLDKTIEGLPKFAPNGSEYHYSVREEIGARGPLFGYKVYSTNGETKLEDVNSNNLDGLNENESKVVLINLGDDESIDATFVNLPNQEYVMINASKQWLDEGFDGLRPEPNEFAEYLQLWRYAPAQSVQLIGGADEVKAQQVTNAVFEVTKEDPDTGYYTINVTLDGDDQFEKFAPNGMPWVYVIKEIDENGDGKFLDHYVAEVDEITESALVDGDVLSFEDPLVNSIYTSTSFKKRFVDENGEVLTHDVLGSEITVNFKLQYAEIDLTADPNESSTVLEWEDITDNPELYSVVKLETDELTLTDVLDSNSTVFFGDPHVIDNLPRVFDFGTTGTSDIKQVVYRVVESSITIGGHTTQVIVTDSDNGHTYTYSVDNPDHELIVPGHYDTAGNATTSNPWNTVVTTNVIKTRDLIVSKTWEDAGNLWETRPMDGEGRNWQVQFLVEEQVGESGQWKPTKIYQNDKLENLVVTIQGSNAQDHVSVTVEGLPEYKLNDANEFVEVKYRVSEIDPSDPKTIFKPDEMMRDAYQVSYPNDTSVTNAMDMTDIEVVKNWVGGNNAVLPGTRVQFKLQVKTGEDQWDDVTIDGQTVLLTLDGQADSNTSNQRSYEDASWHGVFKNLPLRYPASYLPKQDSVSEYRIVEIQGTGFTQINASKDGYEFTFENQAIQDIRLNKQWSLPDGQDRATVTVALKRKVGETIDSSFVEYNAIELSQVNNFTATIKNLPVFSNDGSKYTYYIEEVSSEGQSLNDYEIYYSGEGTTQLSVRNVALIDISVTKTWFDQDAAELRPDTIDLTLVQTNAEGSEVALDVVPTWTKDSDNVWSYVFENLPYADASGKPYTYTVKEAPVVNTNGESYESTIDGYDLTNRITGTVHLTIIKEWFDHDDSEGKRPESIEVNIIQWIDGESTLYDTVTLNPQASALRQLFTQQPQNIWSYTIEDLPKYDENGRLIQYTVEEVKVDGYTSEIETQPKVDVDSVDIMAKINNIASGDLVIQKTVSGNRGDANRYFTFRIELDEPINGLYGSTIFEDGVANVLLRHGQTIEIPDLPGNVGYTITEVQANQNGYTTTDSGNTTGMILPNETVTVSFENRNHYIPDPTDHPIWTPEVTTGYQFVLTDDK